jgi:hypothetical protein
VRTEVTELLETLFSSQGESWTNFQLLPEEYRLAAEANVRAALLNTTKSIEIDAFAPEPTPEPILETSGLAFSRTGEDETYDQNDFARDAYDLRADRISSVHQSTRTNERGALTTSELGV